MKNFVLGLAAISMLAACGSADDSRQVLLDSCIADGEVGKETCTCVIDAMDEHLDDKQMATIAEAVKSGEDDDAAMEELMSDMDESDAMAMGMAMLPCMTKEMEGLMGE